MKEVAGGVITCLKFPFIAYCNYAFMSVSCLGRKFYIGRLWEESCVPAQCFVFSIESCL